MSVVQAMPAPSRRFGGGHQERFRAHHAPHLAPGGAGQPGQTHLTSTVEDGQDEGVGCGDGGEAAEDRGHDA
jgi:hypothetical protein